MSLLCVANSVCCAAFIQGWAESLGLFFGLGSAFIAIHGVANAMIFMTTFRYEVKFPSPFFLPRPKLARCLVSLIGGHLVAGLDPAQ